MGLDATYRYLNDATQECRETIKIYQGLRGEFRLAAASTEPFILSGGTLESLGDTR